MGKCIILVAAFCSNIAAEEKYPKLFIGPEKGRFSEKKIEFQDTFRVNNPKKLC